MPTSPTPRHASSPPTWGPAILYHLHLPQHVYDPSSDRYGDVGLNTSFHTTVHNRCRSVHLEAAASAHGTSAVLCEPPDHDTFSPGKRPDIYIPHLATVFDVKVGRLFISSLQPALRSRAAHTAFAATADRFYAQVLGRAERGSDRDGPFDPVSGHGHVPAVPAEYAGALARGFTARVLLSECTGAPHHDVRAFHRECAVAYALRYEGSVAP